MSLNRTLDRLFDEIRREAKRNPEFADRLDAVLRAHESRREVADELIEAAAAPVDVSEAGDAAAAAPAPPALNPVGLYKRQGEEGLAQALGALDERALVALVVEHNLDPSGAAAKLDREGLAAHILAQAKRRAERDEKMFDY
jgi:hypothetical protein